MIGDFKPHSPGTDDTDYPFAAMRIPKASATVYDEKGEPVHGVVENQVVHVPVAHAVRARDESSVVNHLKNCVEKKGFEFLGFGNLDILKRTQGEAAVGRLMNAASKVSYLGAKEYSGEKTPTKGAKPKPEVSKDAEE